MKIGIVAEPYEESHASGMGYSVLEILKNFLNDGKGHEFVFYSSTPINKQVIPGSYTNILIPKNFFKKLLWFFFIKEKPDVLVFMLPLMPLVVPRNIKVVPMFHELGSQKMKPGGLYNNVVAIVRDRLLMPICLSRSAHVVAVSEATKADILTHYRISEDKITVVYDGFQDWSYFRDDSVVIPEEIRPYFFFAGKIKYRKNVHGLVKAFIAFKERTNLDCNLVIAGDYSGGYYESIMQDLREHNLTHNVFFVGYISSSQIYAYFTNALACTFPSLNEGFGMPIAEAMSLGTPVITSNISATAEIAGDAGLLVDPYNSDEISQAMEKIYRDENLRKELIVKGLERAKQFSWSKAAREYLNVIART